MNPFLSTKSDEEKLKPSKVLGGILGGFDEIGFEMETPSATSVVKGVSSLFEDIFSLGQDIAGTEKKSAEETKKFPPQGTIEFPKAVSEAQDEQKKKDRAQDQRIFFQGLKEDTQRAKEAKDKLLFEEEISDISTNMPTDEKNRLLHYQASYKDRSIYQRAELRRKIIEERKKADKQQKEASMSQTQSKTTAMNAAFEGGSGSQGGGQSNLSFQATG